MRLAACGRRQGEPVFASLVLAAIVTALLCALLPGGLPSTTSVGSAFSPWTTSVSLKAPPSVRAVTKRVIKSGDADPIADATAAADTPALAALAAAIPGIVEAAGAAGPAPQVANLPSPALLVAYPRGPPAA